MAGMEKKGWLMRQLEHAFVRAYRTVQVNPATYLEHLREAHNLPVVSYHGVFSVPVEQLDEIARDTVNASMKLAATEGAGFGLGGFLTILPDLSILAGITMRMIQKLSLIYGFQFNTDEEIAELWVAAASAAGVDISRELLEREVVQKFIPKVIQRIATSASTEVVEKWAGRVVPIASSAVGGILNYFFVRAWGERASRHFRDKHLRLRGSMLMQDARPGAVTLLPPSDPR